ncbi:MAG: hypothetical protein IJF90_09585 [Synergistaceae bacterium]|nr:hypothetical protein [Synergistaceae bacterium]MBQ3653474.1 hypothetical protein [Synergistaceae bacterium]
MSDEFVRKDVYEAEQEHIISLIQAAEKRIDDTNDDQNRNVAIITLAITVMGIIIMGLQIFIAVYK